MIDWHSCQICCPLEIKILLLLHFNIPMQSLHIYANFTYMCKSAVNTNTYVSKFAHVQIYTWSDQMFRNVHICNINTHVS